MPYDPMPTQVADSDAMLLYNHALLYAEAGTGKTVTALEAFKKGGYRRLVVVAPKIALTMWHNELRDHLGVKHVRVIRSGRLTKNKFAGMKEADAIIVTYDLCKNRHVAEMLRKYTFNRDEPVACILDESHYLKGFDSQRTKAILGAQHNGAYCFTECCDDVWFLTGDPLMNYQNDYYTSLKYARPDILKFYGVDTYDKFMNEFCVVERKRHHPRQQVVKPRAIGDRNTPKLVKLLKACGVIQRTLEEVNEHMPPITHRSIEAELSTSLPKGSVKGMTDKQIEKALNDPDSELSRIRRLLGMAKVESVSEYVLTLTPPLLIGAWHRDVVSYLVKEIKEFSPNWVVEEVTGSTPVKKRDEIQTGFNDGSVQVIVGQMGAMNVSWNLQAMCKNVVIAEELPSHGLVHQFLSRVYRTGQKNHVQVDYMESVHEIDTVLALIRARKRTTKEAIRKGLTNG